MTPNLDNPHSPLARLRAERAELLRKLEPMKHHALLSPKAKRLMGRISEIDARLRELEDNLTCRLSDVLPANPEGRVAIYRILTKIPLAADLLYNLFVELKSAVQRLGVREVTFTEMIKRAKAAVSAIVATIDDPQMTGLFDFLSDDDRLVADLSLLIDRYIDDKTAELLAGKGGDK